MNAGVYCIDSDNLLRLNQKFVSIEKLKVLTSNNDFFLQNEKNTKIFLL